MKNIKSPYLAKWLLYKFTSSYEKSTILGDVEEYYNEISRERTLLKARYWYWNHTLNTVFYFIRNFFNWGFAMFKNFFKTALRNMKRHKGFSFINILGLAIGIACSLVVTLYVTDELSYDKYHEYKDRIFRVSQYERSENHTSIDPNTAPPLAPALKETYPEVEVFARTTQPSRSLVRYGDKSFYEEKVFSADPQIFQILTIPFIKGEPSTALEKPNSVVITNKLAEKYFGSDDPIGKVIKVDNLELEITGIVADHPEHTHLKYDLIWSMNRLKDRRYMSNWLAHFIYTYIKVKPKTDIEAFEKRMSKVGDLYAEKVFKRIGYSYTFFLQPVADIHLYPCPHTEPEPPGNPLQLILFSIIGFLVLAIACINFINLKTARSSTRAKEIGLRKVIGANKSNLIFQFLGESFLITFCALILALMLVYLVLPFLNIISGKFFIMADFLKPERIITIGFLLFLTGLFSGIYPAFVLSSFEPVSVLKGHTLYNRKSMLRKILVVGQFTISIILIVGTVVIYQQLEFMKTRDLGFDKEQKLVIPVEGGASITDNYETVKNEFLSHSAVTGAAVSSSVPGEGRSMYLTLLVGQKDRKEQSIYQYQIDEDFISLYNIQLIAGRTFNREIASDKKEAFMINESTLKAFGWKSPEEALGKQIYSGNTGETGSIIGVVRDFHFQGLQKEIVPLILGMAAKDYDLLTLKINAEDMKSTISFVENKWKELFGGVPFKYFFLDKNFQIQYRREEILGKVLRSFTAMGILIACLGLFSLSSFMAEQRKKEIGIRKVLGSSVANIIKLLSKEFVILLIISNIIAWPVAFYALNKFLENFAYRISLNILTFLAAGITSIFIALFTVSYQSIKAAAANPVDSLRNE